MSDIDIFFSVTQFSQSEEKIEAGIILNKEHEIYGGHFPGQPVVPGVMQIEIVRQLAERHFNKKLFIEKVISAKYLQPILPGKQQNLSISFSAKEKEEKVSVSANIFHNGVVLSKIRIVCHPQS